MTTDEVRTVHYLGGDVEKSTDTDRHVYITQRLPTQTPWQLGRPARESHQHMMIMKPSDTDQAISYKGTVKRDRDIKVTNKRQYN